MSCAHRVGNLTCWLSASTRRHHLWPVCISKDTSNNYRKPQLRIAVLVMACVHRLMDINRSIRIVSRLHRPLERKITQGLHVSAMVCESTGQHRFSLPSFIQVTSVMARPISQGLYASDVICAHLETNVGLWHMESSKACIHNLGECVLVESHWCRPTIGTINKGLFTLSHRRRPTINNIR